MSSIITKKKTVVLFTPGLGMDGHFFDQTIINLKNESFKVVEYPLIVNMEHFQVSKNRFVTVDKGYLVHNKNAFETFNTHISDICKLADANSKKAVLVRVDLKTFPSFSSGTITPKDWDSVSNQASKLAYIVKAIKTEDSNINVILVGHSQGGLVNLETATRIPDKIKRLISISTPYREVLAADLLTIGIIAGKIAHKATGVDVLKMIGDVTMDIDDVNCQNRVFDLASEPFFNALHARWNALENKPPLTVITGTSGHLITKDMTVIRTKQSFDGLVRTSEQKGVTHAKFVNLANTCVPCYAKKTIFNETCHDSIVSPCYYLCPLPNFGLGNAIGKVSIKAFLNSIKDGNMDDFISICGEEALKILTAIVAGLARDSSLLDPYYKDYYDVYASDYSHRYLPECGETIGTLLAEFES